MYGRLLVLLLILLSGCATSDPRGSSRASVRDPASELAPHWIWPNEHAADGEEAWFRKRFDVAGELASATLWVTGDDRVELFLNGKSVAQSNRWKQPVSVDVIEHLRPGINVVGAWAKNDGGDAGLCVDLELVMRGGRTEHVLSDSSWRATSEDPGSNRMLRGAEIAEATKSWDTARSLGALGEEPWKVLDPAVPYVLEEATSAVEITVPDGFVAERIYSVPRVRQGSWVSLTVDDTGRLIASDQYGGLYRITPPAFGAPGYTGYTGETVDGTVVEELDLELGEAHGLLYAFDALYAVVSGAGRFESGLYRARDTDGDDAFDLVECLQPLDGSGEHGPHAVLLGSDRSSLYVFAGNHTSLPGRLARSRVPWLWGEDQLLPRIADPGGHAVDKLAPGGWVCRTNPDGKEWELVAMGFRNAYDGGFTPDGELLAYDADMEWDVGLPWYRPPRIVHVTDGAEFGWRHGSGKWPADYADSLPPVVNLGLGSPTGCTFGTDTGFPEPWRSAFFAADWSYGTIHAVHLEPRGSSFVGTVEPFVSGRALPITDLVVGLDGALYFLTGGRRMQSGLYRVRWVGSEHAPVRASTQRRDTTLASRRAQLEASHVLGDEEALALAWDELNASDRFLRFAARTAIELRKPELWADRALAETRPRASLEALLALVRSGAALPEQVFPRLVALPWESLDGEGFVTALRVTGLAFLRVPGADASRDEVVRRLDPLFPTGVERTDRELCRLLAYLETPRLVPRALALLEDADSQETAIDYAYSLRVVRGKWTEDERARFLGFLDYAIENYEGGASLRGYLERIREETVLASGWLAIADSEPSPPSNPDSEATSGANDAARNPVTYWTLAALAPELERVDADRSYALGLRAYERAGCAECHRLGGVGRNQGPDLTGAGARFNARDLLESILEPSNVVADPYQDTEVWTHDDRLFVGRYEGTVDSRLRLRAPPPATELYEIHEEEVALRRPHPLSRMPEDLLNPLSEGEILDLLAFVLGLSASPEKR